VESRTIGIVPSEFGALDTIGAGRVDTGTTGHWRGAAGEGVRDGVKGAFDGVEDEDLDGTVNVVEVIFLSRMRSWIRAS
jgi:hypothetical protein